nr:hypothetical protein [Micromonospora sp. KC721]
MRAVPADNSTGPYTYLHTQTWARATTTITRTDLRRWRHPDGSGQEITRRLPDLPAVDHQPKPAERALFARAQKTIIRHLAGDLHPYLPEPPPVDPAALAGLLAPPELSDEPAYPRLLVGGVVGLATSQYLHHEQRAACLRVLAIIPTIAYQGETKDIAGRPGLAFAVTADGSTSTIVIDARTGELLAAHERVTGPRPGLFAYVLVVERGRTASVGDTVRPRATRPTGRKARTK